jgi:plastocyanin
MKLRCLVAAVLLVAVTLGFSTAGTAQTSSRKVIEITMTSFKFEPSEIRVNEGDTVVIRLKNADTAGRPHNVASRYFAGIPLTVRGDGREGAAEDRKFVQVDAGKTAEFEFKATARGSSAFICSVFIHAFAGMTGQIYVRPAGSP